MIQADYGLEERIMFKPIVYANTIHRYITWYNKVYMWYIISCQHYTQVYIMEYLHHYYRNCVSWFFPPLS